MYVCVLLYRGLFDSADVGDGAKMGYETDDFLGGPVGWLYESNGFIFVYRYEESKNVVSVKIIVCTTQLKIYMQINKNNFYYYINSL